MGRYLPTPLLGEQGGTRGSPSICCSWFRSKIGSTATATQNRRSIVRSSDCLICQVFLGFPDSPFSRAVRNPFLTANTKSERGLLPLREFLVTGVPGPRESGKCELPPGKDLPPLTAFPKLVTIIHTENIQRQEGLCLEMIVIETGFIGWVRLN